MVPLCVIACAGSGKTKTAVHRLVRIRRNLGEARGRVGPYFLLRGIRFYRDGRQRSVGDHLCLGV
nr:hypothetical protein [Burkholderia sp. MS455]